MESKTTSNNSNKESRHCEERSDAAISPIAFFDSGVGGLTVYKKLKELLPNENYLYFGDTKNVPYGEKTPEELLVIADKIFKFFESKHAKAVVMACNTTSAVVYDKIKAKYNFKIYPVIQSVAGVLAELPVKRLGVFATKATVESGAYSRAIPCKEVFEIAPPEWVQMVESGNINADLVRKPLEKMLAFNPEKIVLGCTHYPYLLPVLTQFAPADMFIDPAYYFAKFIASSLLPNVGEGGRRPDEGFYVSANPENFVKAAKMFYEVKNIPDMIQLQ